MPIKVMIIDDSAVVRETLKSIFASDGEFEVVAQAADPIIAASKLETIVPDVITLDIEMPRLDGLSFLKALMSQHPLPVVICSSVSETGSANALKAMEFGAMDIIQKPKMGTREFLLESQATILDVVRGAYAGRHSLTKKKFATEKPSYPAPKLNADVMLPKANSNTTIDTTEKIIVVGASTGGTEALRDFLVSLPLNTPGIVIVQHMPEHFTKAFADRLDSLCTIRVKEAENNDSIVRGTALIAPGNKHCMVKRSGARYYVEIKDGPLVSRHRPSVDVLFRSSARYAGQNAVAVILTGMGDDGAEGMKELHDSGAYCIAQNEDTCVVYGMPKEAVKRGAIDIELGLPQIADHVLQRIGKMGG